MMQPGKRTSSVHPTADALMVLVYSPGLAMMDRPSYIGTVLTTPVF